MLKQKFNITERSLQNNVSDVAALKKSSKRVAYVDTNGDLVPSGGYRQQMGPFYTINMAANTNAGLRMDSNSALSSYICMLGDGSVLEIAVFLDATLTSGTSDLDIRLLKCSFGTIPSSSDTVIQNISMSDSSPIFSRTTFEKDQLTFKSGEILTLRAFTDASWTSTTTDIWAWIKVEI